MLLHAVFVSLLLLLSALPASAQILNTLSGFENRDGWQGQASGFVRVSGGNTELEDYLASLVGQWQSERHRVRPIVSWSLSKNQGIETRDDFRAHLRHNYRLRPGVATLAFAQVQRNPFQQLESRTLLGAGLRFDLVQDPRRKAGLGISAMYEHNERTGAGTTDFTRLSVFLDFDRQLKEYLEFAIVGWYQPDLADFSNLRASVVADLAVDLAGPLELVTEGVFEHDSSAPADVEDSDWSVRLGLRITI